MKIKELSQKHSVFLFYSTIILIVISIGLICLNVHSLNRDKNFNVNRERMMQNGQNNNSYGRLNRQGQAGINNVEQQGANVQANPTTEPTTQPAVQ